jgi:hypothetical protein
MHTLLVSGLLALLVGGASDKHVGWFPDQLAGGTRLERPTPYDNESVFDYMDGRAEVYLTFAYQQVTVAPYKVGAQRVDVMLFDLSTPAEAFGVWSLDYEGQHVDVMQNARWLPGTLRAWQGPYFLKVECEADAPEAKRFALEIARHFAAKIPAGPPLPPLAASLPREALKASGLRYFHHFDNLGGIFYISTRNVLELDYKTQVLFADAKWRNKPVKVMLVQYPSAAQATKAWDGFLAKVLSNKAVSGPAGERTEELAAGLFAGIRRMTGPKEEPRLVLTFETGSAEACREVLAALAKAAGPQEAER